jgi:hypothetical protein
MLTQFLLYAGSFETPEVRMVGVSMCTAENGSLKVVRRVSDVIKWKGDNKAKMSILVDPWTTIQKREQYLNLLVLARAMIRLLPKTDEEGMEEPKHGKYFRTNDMIACINEILLHYGPSGEPYVGHEYTASTIMDNILTNIGIGLSESDRYMFNSQEAWRKWFTLCYLFGIISAKVKGTETQAEIRLEKSGKTLFPVILDAFINCFGDNGHQFDIPGGSTTPWHLMARNIVKGYDLPLYTIIAEEDLDGDIQACEYTRPKKPKAKFDIVEARFGKSSHPVIENMPTEEVRRRVIIHYDMQRYMLPRIDRDLHIWSIGYQQVLANGQMKDAQRRFNWFYGLFFGATRSYVAATSIVPSLKMFSTVGVSFGSTPAGEVTVTKSEDTSAVGQQEPNPTGLPLAKDSTETSHIEKTDGKDDKPVIGQKEEKITTQDKLPQIPPGTTGQ